MYPWTRPLFVIAALYDGLLGLAFLFFPLAIFAHYGVEPPNHPAYVQFPALLLLVFAAMFLRIANSPAKNHDLIPYGMALKASYSGLAFWYAITRGIPSMWIPWAWADLVFLLVFVLSWLNLRKFYG
ncbi:MAG: hypothetical protein WBX11_08390 [Thiobacillaceae bacterium]|jgi:hypothetical protein